MKPDFSYWELINFALKKWRQNDAILTRVEVDEPRLKMFWVKLKDLPEQEIEYDETWKKRKYTKVMDLSPQYKDYETYWWKLCLCDYMKYYRDKIPYYNREYIIQYGIPLYDNSWELVKIRRKWLK